MDIVPLAVELHRLGISEALDAMVRYAQSIGVTTGVAVVSVWHSDASDVTISVSRPNGKSVRQGIAGKNDVNYAAVALAKVAQSMRTNEPSGRDGGLIGEVPYRGSVVYKHECWFVLLGYSGGNEDQDVEISETGLAVMRQFVG